MRSGPTSHYARSSSGLTAPATFSFPFIIVVALFLLLSLASCAGGPEAAPSPESTPQESKSSQELAAEVAKENEVGEAAFAKLAGQYGIVRDESATAYLNKYLQSLALYVERQELTYRAAILDTEQVNAFALPGGYILGTLGTLQQVESP